MSDSPAFPVAATTHAEPLAASKPTAEPRGRASAPAAYRNCPRCGLSIAARFRAEVVSHCPRCIARGRVLVEMFTSTLPAALLYANGSRDHTIDSAEEKPARNSTARGSSEALTDAPR